MAMVTLSVSCKCKENPCHLDIYFPLCQPMYFRYWDDLALALTYITHSKKHLQFHYIQRGQV